MREIKFRAWDSSIRRMLYQTNIEYFDDMIAFRINFDMLGDAQEIIIMQCTGLIDKNGKEIYEGDIIICDRNITPCVDKNTYVVGWSDEDARYNFFYYGGWSEIYASNVVFMEVIGNVYENPELLEVKKK